MSNAPRVIQLDPVQGAPWYVNWPSQATPSAQIVVRAAPWYDYHCVVRGLGQRAGQLATPCYALYFFAADEPILPWIGDPLYFNTDFDGSARFWSAAGNMSVEPVLTAIIVVKSDNGLHLDPDIDLSTNSPVPRLAFKGTSIL